MQLIDSKLTTCDFVNKAGEIVFSQPLPPHHEGYPNLYAHRSHSQILFYEYAMSVGIEIIFNTQVTEYFENDHEAGIIVDGQRVTADCVVAADGVHSKARRFVTGVEDNPKPSGFAIFRCFCPIEPFLRDPKVNHLIPEQGDRLIIWIGEDTHGIIQTQKQLDGITVFLTHKVRICIEIPFSTLREVLN
jgi:2-polyprenyl-6-methoxyphenol hydroxylase-like FAD-dependent oxidoreductase